MDNKTTYFIPMHCLVPLPKLTRYLSNDLLNSPLGKIHRSGVNFSGEGKISLFWRMKYVDVLTGVYRNMLVHVVYLEMSR
jgi:hypothetical protein